MCVNIDFWGKRRQIRKLFVHVFTYCKTKIGAHAFNQTISYLQSQCDSVSFVFGYFVEIMTAAFKVQFKQLLLWLQIQFLMNMVASSLTIH